MESDRQDTIINGQSAYNFISDMECSMPSTSYKYLAFISYKRTDSKAAKWLQKRLEWFRFPVKLVSDEFHPNHPKYIRPIYRDKTNLDVHKGHYWEDLKKAIDQSRFLIVLCSPDSAKSPYVNKEVIHFLEDPGRKKAIDHIIPVILKGNVGSKNDSECLCPALLEEGSDIMIRNLPTMIPDVDNSEKEGWETGFIGVVSYLLDLERETLSDHCRREERKRSRRIGMLAGLFALLAILAIAGGIIAWDQREKAVKAENTAIEQKNKATHSLAMAHIDRAHSAHQNGDLLLAAQASLAAFQVEDHPATQMAAWEYLLALPMESPAFTTRGSHRGTLCLLSDGEIAVSGGNSVTVWNASGKELVSWPAKGADVVGMAEGDDGDVWVLKRSGHLLLGKRDGSLIEAAFLEKTCASLSVAGRRLAVGTQKGKVYVFHLGSHLPEKPELLDLPAEFSKEMFVALSRDGETVFISHNAPGNNGQVMAVKTETAEIIWEQRDNRPARLCLSADGQLLSWYTMEGTIQVVDVNDGRTVQRTRAAANLIGWMGFGPDGRELVYAYQEPNRDDGVMEVLDVATGAVRRIYEGMGKLHTALFISADRVLSSGYNAGRWVEMSDSRRHRLVDEIIWRIRLENDRAYLFCAGKPNWLDVMSGEINQRRQMRTMGIVHEMWPSVRGSGGVVRVNSEFHIDPLQLHSKITCSDILPDGAVITGNKKGELHLVQSGDARLLRSFDRPLRYLHAGANGIVVYGFDGFGKGGGLIRILDKKKTSEIYTCKQTYPMLTASEFISGTSHVCLAAGPYFNDRLNDASIFLIDSNNGNSLNEIKLSVSGAIRDLRIIPGKDILVAALASGEVAIISLPQLKLIRRIPVSNAPIFRLSAIPGKDDLLAAGDGKGVVHIIALQSGKTLYRTTACSSPVTAMTLTDDEWWIAFENRLERWRNVLDPQKINDYKQVRYHSMADLRQMAIAAGNSGDAEQAIKYWLRIAQFENRDVTGLTEVVRLQRKLGRFSEALETIDRIVGIGSAQAKESEMNLNFLSHYEILKGNILYEKWKKTGNADALNHGAEFFLRALSAFPQELPIHIALFSILIDDGHAKLGTRACRSFLQILDQQEKRMDTLPIMDIIQGGILCAMEAGITATSFQDPLQKEWKKTKLPLSDGILDVWLGKSDGKNIAWEELSGKDAAKLHFLLAMQCRNEGQLKKARRHFMKGIEKGDWHAFNKRGLDALEGKNVHPNLSDFYSKMYGFILDLHHVMTLETDNEIRQGLVELASSWEDFLDISTQKELPLRWLAMVYQLLGDIEQRLGDGKESLKSIRKCVAIFRELVTITGKPNDVQQYSGICGNLCWMELMHSNFDLALAAGKQAVSLLPNDNVATPNHMNLAHAFLFNDQFDKAKSIYEKFSGTLFEDGRKWNEELRNDFNLLSNKGLHHPDMDQIESIPQNENSVWKSVN